MSFKSTTDRLMQNGVPLRLVAKHMSLTLNSVCRMRRNPSDADLRNRNALNPPLDWQQKAAMAALEQANEFEIRASKLRSIATQLRGNG